MENSIDEKTVQLVKRMEDIVLESSIHSALQFYPNGTLHYIWYPSIIARAEEFSDDLPSLVENLALFLIQDKYSPQEEHKIGWRLNSESVMTGIQLLDRIKKTPEYVALEVVKGIKGKCGSYHTIKRYVEGILPIKLSLKTSFPDVYKELFKEITRLITSEMIEDAIRQSKLSRDDKEKEKSIAPESYSEIKNAKRSIDTGEFEKDLRHGLDNTYGWDYRPKQQYDPITSHIEDGYLGGRETVNKQVRYFQDTVLHVFNELVSDLEAGLGKEEFQKRGYERVRSQIEELQTDVESTHVQINTRLGELEKKLREERSKRKNPLKRLFG